MVRIALISDIHFGRFSRTAELSVPGEPIKDENAGGISLTESLISVLKKTNTQYLCIAGDLTSLGSPQEFFNCEKALLDIADRAEIPRDNVILGLGNHDIDWKISDLYSNFEKMPPDFPHDLVREKYREMAAQAALINIENIPPLNKTGPAPYTGIIENKDFVMFVLNTGCYSTRDQSFPRGKLDAKQLEWFESIAKEYSADSRWKIVMMHHHPFNYSFPIPGPDISTLEEGSRFLEIAGQNGIRLVLHGHRHHPRAETDQKNGWNYPITFICAGSLAVNAAHRHGEIPNTLHIIDLSDEVGVLELYSYQFSSALGWIPIKSNCPETPIDHKMLLGKIFDADKRIQAIKDLSEPAEMVYEVTWESLDESLRFLPVDKLNQQITEQLSNTHKMIGSFPNDVVLIRKEANHG
ncbi:MAG: metallophosphoesterase family protein [Oscillospiraceae bacterium]|jgi:3',5'-cyclic AMP phosphodiesterase CpdA